MKIQSKVSGVSVSYMEMPKKYYREWSSVVVMYAYDVYVCLQLLTCGMYECINHVMLSAVTDLQARTFATWTLTTCMLCLLCSRYTSVVPIYGGF